MRRRRAPGNTRALLAEVCDQVTLSQYASMLSPDLEEMACTSYARLVELVKELSMPAPPPLAEMGRSGEFTALDGWLEDSGLYHVRARWCRLRDDGHWAHQCS